MTLHDSGSSILYAPQIDEFAKQISDDAAEVISTDPVVRSTAYRQAVDLVEPDWIVVSENTQFVSPASTNESGDSLAFGDPDTTNLSEVIRILADVHEEPVVPLVPDPVSTTLDTFGEGWTDLFETDEFAALDVLHGASQLFSDVIRSFEGNCPGIFFHAKHLSKIVDAQVPLDDYLLEMGPVFNIADHHNVSVGGIFPPGFSDDHIKLAEEFDFVVYTDVQPSALEHISTAQIGCSFPASFWDAPDQNSFRETCDEYLDATATKRLLLMPPIPPTVEPEYVQILGDAIAERM